MAEFKPVMIDNADGMDTTLGAMNVDKETGNIIFITSDGEVVNSSGGSVTISAEPHNRLSQRADGLYSDGVGIDELTEIRGDLPTTEQMEEYNARLAENYVKIDELTEIDFKTLEARVAAIEAQMGGA